MLPTVTITVSIASGVVAIKIGWGDKGMIDATYRYTNTELIGTAA